MSELVWNDGMSVGIDAIDEDHKQIIAILAKLTASRCQNISNNDIEEIFSELETYVTLHFSREEKLLEKVFYKDLIAHKASHREFIEKLPSLKQQWLSEDNGICCEKISSFLNHWLVDHIFKDDFDYIGVLQSSSNPEIQRLNNAEFSAAHHSSNGVSNSTKNNSLLAKFSHNISQKIKLSTRVLIIAVVPVIGVFLLSLLIVQNNYQQYKNKTILLSLNNIIMQVNNVTHSLQAERGLSSGVVSLGYENLLDSLVKQRLISDQEIAKFLTAMTNESDPLVQQNIKSYFDLIRIDLNELTIHRQHLDNKSESFLEIYQVYTLLIEQLLSISENLSNIDMKSKFTNNISAINSMLMFKEYMGQIRAIGMNLLSNKYKDIQTDLDVRLLMGKQIHALRVFNSSATDEQKQACADFCNETKYVTMLNQEFVNTMNYSTAEQRTAYWFTYMSGEINKLKGLTDTLTSNFKSIAQVESLRLRGNYLVSLFLLSLFMFAMLLFSSILNFSILSPIRRLTHALNNMAKGNLTIHFNHSTNDDEIGAMQRAYEELRRNLLQVNIFKAVVDSQKKEIEYRKSQQEHFQTLAFTDALTGAVNRHQFNRVLDEEIVRADYDKQDLSILMLDIDNFKNINDSYGHGIGDDVLIMFYNACKKAVRTDDVVARIGGEEFVIVLPKTNAKSAYQFAERLREKIQNIDIDIDDNTVKFTVSIGVSQWQNTFSSAEDFVDSADKLLYEAKNQGRNKVVGA